MTLEQNVENLCFTSGDGYEVETLPREIFSGPFAPDLEPEQIPFLVAPTQLIGYHDIVIRNGEPVRKLLLGLADPKKSQRFSLLGPNAQQISVYDSPENALFELQPRVLPYQRQNTEKFFASLERQDATLRFFGGGYSGAVSFAGGKTARATLRTPKETLYGEPALSAFLLLFSYQPIQFESRGTETRRLSPESASVVEPLAACALPAYAHTLREKLESRGLDQHLFNVKKENGIYQRAGSPDYSVVVRFSKVPVGLLRFVGGKYYDGEIRGDEPLTGDEALRRALELSNEPTITLERTDSEKVLQLETVGSLATRSALATTALYLTPQ